MNILHYTLGLPPCRGGGLTRYSVDLMRGQKKLGNFIALLFPYYPFPYVPVKPRVIKKNNYDNISVYALKRVYPIPLLDGIKKPEHIYNSNNLFSINELENFFEKIKPDVFHIHTMMGLSYEILSFFEKKKVPIVYTTHDYYGLCPKVNFINRKGEVCDGPNANLCSICNNDAPSAFYLFLRNNPLLLKSRAVLLRIFLGKARKMFEGKVDYEKVNITNERYLFLYEYYKKMFGAVDKFIFNSFVSKSQYERYIVPEKSSVVYVTHSEITDCRAKKEINYSNIKIAFIGSLEPYKGYPLLKSVLLDIYGNDSVNWSLYVWGSITGTDSQCANIFYKGKYKSSELSFVYNSIDLLVVPSIWYETFGLVVLEALSYGVPVLVSDRVGASDLVVKYDAGVVFSPNREDLYNKILFLIKSPDILSYYNNNICKNGLDFLFFEHVREILDSYSELLI